MSKATGDSRYQEVADKALLQDSNVPPSSYILLYTVHGLFSYGVIIPPLNRACMGVP